MEKHGYECGRNRLSNTLSELKRFTPSVPQPTRQAQVSSFPSAEQNVLCAEGHVSLKGLHLALLSSVSRHDSNVCPLPMRAISEGWRVVFPYNFFIWDVEFMLSTLFRTSEIRNKFPPLTNVSASLLQLQIEITILVGK